MPRSASRHSPADGKVLSLSHLDIGELILPCGKSWLGTGEMTYQTTGSGGAVAQLAAIIRKANSVAVRRMGALCTESPPGSRIDAGQLGHTAPNA